MGAFKFENCTSKQYVRQFGWIPEARKRQARLREAYGGRRIRYLTFCAEKALDVVALMHAKVVKRSGKKLYDTVCFFDTDRDSIDRTLANIEGATPFEFDFFELMAKEGPEVLEGAANALPSDREESDATFEDYKAAVLYEAFQKAFPFDLLNLDVERYFLQPAEQLPGRLVAAWDKLLEWQKRARVHDGEQMRVTEFTVFFTTRIGPHPHDLPPEHRDHLIGVLDRNIEKFPNLKELTQERFATHSGAQLFADRFPDFLKLAVPKALVTHALKRDWALDMDQAYLVFEFDRQPANADPYTMIHYVLHFRRCEPSLDAQMDGMEVPQPVQAVYEAAVQTLFAAEPLKVDEIKLPIEDELRAQLKLLGVEV